jgi:hypothetical protein
MVSVRLEQFPITVFKRAGSPYCCARFTPPGAKQTRLVLDTEVRNDAEKKAVEAHWEAKMRVAAGLTAKKRTFGDAADVFMRRRNQTTTVSG